MRVLKYLKYLPSYLISVKFLLKIVDLFFIQSFPKRFLCFPFQRKKTGKKIIIYKTPRKMKWKQDNIFFSWKNTCCIVWLIDLKTLNFCFSPIFFNTLFKKKERSGWFKVLFYFVHLKFFFSILKLDDNQWTTLRVFHFSCCFGCWKTFNWMKIKCQKRKKGGKKIQLLLRWLRE